MKTRKNKPTEKAELDKLIRITANPFKRYKKYKKVSLQILKSFDSEFVSYHLSYKNNIPYEKGDYFLKVDFCFSNELFKKTFLENSIN